MRNKSSPSRGPHVQEIIYFSSTSDGVIDIKQYFYAGNDRIAPLPSLYNETQTPCAVPIPFSVGCTFLRNRESEGANTIFFIFFFIFCRERERENVGDLQQFSGVAAGGAGGRWQQNAVAEDDGGEAAEPVRGEQGVGGVAAGGGTRAVGLHTPQRITVASQVNAS